LLINLGKANWKVTDLEGRTALHCAALSGHFEVVKFLCEEGKVNVNTHDTAHSMTALHYAAWSGYARVVRYLVQSGNAHVNAKDRWGNIPLHVAAQGGRASVMKYITDNTNVDTQDVEGRTALHLSALRNHGKAVRWLCEIGKAKMEVRDNRGNTALYLGYRHLPVVKPLVELGADISVLRSIKIFIHRQFITNFYEQSKLMFFMGFHSRLGLRSSISLFFSGSSIYEPQLIRMILEFYANSDA